MAILRGLSEYEAIDLNIIDLSPILVLVAQGPVISVFEILLFSAW